MLQGDFYILGSISAESQTVKALLELNPAHQIFEGHFPGQPVVPGVCMMQMVKETVETVMGKKTRLIRADYAKFLAMIDPRKHALISLELTYTISEKNEIDILASLFYESIIFFKYKAVMVPFSEPSARSNSTQDWS
jgi:3-hydroxyacyl-[acyl-carrier-protein] dehydratase